MDRQLSFRVRSFRHPRFGKGGMDVVSATTIAIFLLVILAYGIVTRHRKQAHTHR